MSEKSDYFDYVENVLGVKSIMLNRKQNIPLLIAVEDLNSYGVEEQDLLGKMVGALKVEMQRISLVDMSEAEKFESEFTVYFMNQPIEKQSSKNTVTTFSPRTLLKKPELKKNAWTDLQKVLTYFNPVN